jgi:hypothetical protein
MAKVIVSDQMVDATQTLMEPYHEVEVYISPDTEGYSLWVNIDGTCRLRATRIPKSALMLSREGF